MGHPCQLLLTTTDKIERVGWGRTIKSFVAATGWPMRILFFKIYNWFFLACKGCVTLQPLYSLWSTIWFTYYNLTIPNLPIRGFILSVTQGRTETKCGFDLWTFSSTQNCEDKFFYNYTCIMIFHHKN